MEGLLIPGFDAANAVRKKRSNPSRRPRMDTSTLFDIRNCSPSSSMLPPDTVGGDNACYVTGFKRKEINLNSSTWKASSVSRKDNGSLNEFDRFYKRIGSKGGSSSRNEDTRNVSDIRRCSEGALALANWRSSSKVKDGSDFHFKKHSGSNGNGRSVDNRSLGQSGVTSSEMGNRGDASSNEKKLRKVKLKVGGVTRTIHAKSTSDGANDGSYMKPLRSLDVSQQRQKPYVQDNSDDNRSPPEHASEMQGISWKDFHGGRLSQKSKEDLRGRGSEANARSHGGPTSEPVRKSKRVPKKRVLDGAFDDADVDDEIRYLERLKSARAGLDYGNEFGNNEVENNKKSKSSKNRRKLNGEYEVDVEEYGSSRCKKKSRSERDSEDGDFLEEDEEDEHGFDLGFEAKRKKQKKEYVDSLMDGKKEVALTMRQRALQSGKDASNGANATLIEFPNGLPPAPPRKQKEKLSEMELQLKRAEAAQRRKMQNEKAALESQREAIRKILGQDATRKKREDQQRKRRDELAQEKAANAMLAGNTVRWVMGPTGTTVTFPMELGLPSIFDQKPCSYPPPREKCAGPSCTNVYKYRDSKSKLPLCSLQCYRAINETKQPVTIC